MFHFIYSTVYDVIYVLCNDVDFDWLCICSFMVDMLNYEYVDLLDYSSPGGYATQYK